MDSVGIIGYGRFGKVLTDLLKDRYHVKVYDVNPTNHSPVEFVSQKILLQEKILFIAVPMNKFEGVIQSIGPQLLPGTTVFDVCSIKRYPVEIMQKYLPKSIGIIATHPLFGPDSINLKEKLNFMMYPIRDVHHCYDHWKQFFAKRFTIVEITPDEHDRFAAKSQGIAHFIARVLKAANLKETPIDTPGFRLLLRLIENNCKDSWELFSDLQHYNPYSKAMLEELEKAFEAVKLKL